MIIDYFVKYAGREFSGEAEVSVEYNCQEGMDLDGKRGFNEWNVQEIRVLSCFDGFGGDMDVDDLPEELVGIIEEKMECSEELFDRMGGDEV